MYLKLSNESNVLLDKAAEAVDVAKDHVINRAIPALRIYLQSTEKLQSRVSIAA